MKLIALVGFIGSGKDTAGKYLVDNFGFTSFSFAESLKDALASIFCWDRALLEGHTPESRVWRETVDEWWSAKLGISHFTPRWALQNIGTNVFRQHFHSDIWIHNIERKLTLLPPDSNVVFIDGRFPNELNLAKKYGGKVIRVKRGAEPEWFDAARRANGKLWDGIENRNWMSVMERKKYLEDWRQKIEKDYNIHESEWAWIGQPLDETIENDQDIEHLQREVIRLCL
jgi:hypothetical protein